MEFGIFHEFWSTDAPSQAGGGSELYYDNIKVYRNATK